MQIKYLYIFTLFTVFRLFGQEEGIKSFVGPDIDLAANSFSLVGSHPSSSSHYIELKDFHYEIMQNLPPSVWQSQFGLSAVDNRVTLRYDDTGNHAFNSSWKLKILYSLYENIDEGFSTAHHGELELVYNKDNDPNWPLHQDISTAVFPVSTGTLPHYQGLNPRVYVRDVIFTGDVNDKTYLLSGCTDLFVDVEMRVQKDYVVDGSDELEVHIKDASSFGLTGSSQDFVELSWNYREGAEQYELEWLFIDLGAPADNTDGSLLSHYPNYRYHFKDATRIQLTKNSYKLPLAFPKGLLAFRVRVIGDDLSSDIGPWSSQAPERGEVTDLLAYTHILHSGLHPEKNWVNASGYAEDGLRSDAISFYDGTHRTHLSVSLSNSNEEAIISRSAYDYAGRPTVSILPFATESQGLKYYNQDQVSYYDKSDFDGPSTIASPMEYLTENATDEIATTYYSPENSYEHSHRDYIPDAGNYPFSRTVLRNDGTGRPQEVSGLGPDHRIGSNHTTRYYYNKPSQRQLDALFGNEAGQASFYQRNIVVDPNGQATVSYLDGQGRVVATALSGESDNGNISSLPSLPGSTQEQVYLDGYVQGGNQLHLNHYFDVYGHGSQPHSFDHEVSSTSTSMNYGLSCDNGFNFTYDHTYTTSWSLTNQGTGSSVNLLPSPTSVSVPTSGGAAALTATVGLSSGYYQYRTSIEFEDNFSAVSQEFLEAIQGQGAQGASVPCVTTSDIYIPYQGCDCQETCLQNFMNTGYSLLPDVSGVGGIYNVDLSTASSVDFSQFNLSYTHYYIIDHGSKSSVSLSTSDLFVDDLGASHNNFSQYVSDIQGCHVLCEGSVYEVEDCFESLMDDVDPSQGSYWKTMDLNLIANAQNTGDFGTSFNHNYLFWSSIQDVLDLPLSSNAPSPSIFSGPTSVVDLESLQQNWDNQAFWDSYSNVTFSVDNPYDDGGPSFLTQVPVTQQTIMKYVLLPEHPEFCMARYLCASDRKSYDNQISGGTLSLSPFNPSVLPLGYSSTVGTLGSDHSQYFPTSLPYYTSNSIEDPWLTSLYGSGYSNVVNHSVNIAQSTSSGGTNVVSGQLPDVLDKLEKFVDLGSNAYGSIWYFLVDPHNIHLLTPASATSQNIPLWTLEFFQAYHGDGTSGNPGIFSQGHLDKSGFFNLVYLGFKRSYIYGDLFRVDGQNQPIHGCGTSRTLPTGEVVVEYTQPQTVIFTHTISSSSSYDVVFDNQAFDPNNEPYVDFIIHYSQDDFQNFLLELNDASTPLEVQTVIDGMVSQELHEAYATSIQGWLSGQVNLSFLPYQAKTLLSSYQSYGQLVNFDHGSWTDANGPYVAMDLIHIRSQAFYQEVLSGFVEGIGVSYSGGNTILTLAPGYGFGNSNQPNTTALSLTYTGNASAVSASLKTYFKRYFNHHLNRLVTGQSPEYLWTGDLNADLTDLSSRISSIPSSLSWVHQNPTVVPQPPVSDWLSVSDYQVFKDLALEAYDDDKSTADFVDDIIRGFQIHDQSISLSISISSPVSLSSSLDQVLDQNASLESDLVLEEVSYDQTVDCGCERFKQRGVLAYNEWAQSAGVDELATWSDLESIHFSAHADVVKKFLSFSLQTPEHLITSQQISGFLSKLNEGTSCFSSSSNLSWFENDTDFNLNQFNCNAIHLELNDLCGLATAQEIDAQETAWLNGELYQYLQAFKTSYYNQVFSGLEKTTGMTQPFREFQYTLFYYDLAGNLIKTVPPEGVQLLSGTQLDAVEAYRTGSSTTFIRPDHQMSTKYVYNSFNQLVEKRMPEQGELSDNFGSIYYVYDEFGRELASQSPLQRDVALGQPERFNYILYDDLGRVVESGESILALSSDNYLDIPTSSSTLQSYVVAQGRREVVQTHYSEPYVFPTGSNHALAIQGQQYLRGRVSYTETIGQLGWPLLTQAESRRKYTGSVQVYSYDLHGNVNQYATIQTLSKVSRIEKYMEYDYDLISGNVKEVRYQPGELDQFTHRYYYDANNRLQEVETSTDHVLFTTEAKYTYYPHGPLARVELGEQQVQGVDYAYTIHGWIKSINNRRIDKNHEIGKDGLSFSSGVNRNERFAKDAYASALYYFNGDYKAIGGEHLDGSLLPGAFYASDADLFNGNIGKMTTSLQDQVGDPIDLNGNIYSYDQLNRISSSRSYTSSSNNLGVNTGVVTNRYNTNYTYDKNGNLQSLDRKESVVFDDLSYTYHTANPNKKNILTSVSDQSTNNGSGDVKNTMTYLYDVDGNLTSERHHVSGSGINAVFDNYRYRWNSTGKVKRVMSFTEDPQVVGFKMSCLDLEYGPSGNRLSKTTYLEDFDPSIQVGQPHPVVEERELEYTYYIQDPMGNTIGIYNQGFEMDNGTLHLKTYLKEQPIYGGKRLGIRRQDRLLEDKSLTGISYEPESTLGVKTVLIDAFTSVLQPVGPLELNNNRIFGEKSYELSNHLGNVLSVVSDKKLKSDVNSDGVVDEYYADVVSYSDYYPFGMQMPERKYNGGDYRYGYQGSEKDDEIKGEGNSYTTFYRLLDPRIGRWKSVDPKASYMSWQSPYTSMDNNPILLNDPDGDCPKGIDCGEPLVLMQVRLNRASNLGAGMNRNNGQRWHAGHDLYSPPGATVMSVMDGEVIASAASNSYGNHVTIKHDVKEMRPSGRYTVDPSDPDMIPIPIMEEQIVQTYYTFYAHLESRDVSVGDKVSMGQQIGTVGTTGNASRLTGENVHLHFEIGTALRSPNSHFILRDRKSVV